MDADGSFLTLLYMYWYPPKILPFYLCMCFYWVLPLCFLCLRV